MSIRSKILGALQTSDALCDDCLSEITGVTPRQSINLNCRALRTSNVLARPAEMCARCQRTKIVNRLTRTASIEKPDTSMVISVANSTPNDRPWYWEGNVQDKIIKFLRSSGCVIHSQSDTSTRQQGKDIVARDHDGCSLWITVKGFPQKSANTQARHWFAGALLDLARYKDEDDRAVLAMGLPRGFSTYEGLIRRTEQIRKFLAYQVFWVQADGTVTREQSP